MTNKGQRQTFIPRTERGSCTFNMVIPVELKEEWQRWASLCGIPLSQYIQGIMTYALQNTVTIKVISRYDPNERRLTRHFEFGRYATDK